MMFKFDSDKVNIQNNLLDWFAIHGRHWIPWKLKSDGNLPLHSEIISPYKIWIAEVMLQQTQLKVVIPYWQKWMRSFPDLLELTAADEEELLLHWQGLGYYSRVKRIHLTSKLLLDLIGKDNYLDSSFWPVHLKQWMDFPGIGRSTGGSIISSAFDLPVAILDGNVKRILSRLQAIDTPLSKDQKKLWELSSLLISNDHPRNFNQALMDLGSMVCTPKKPSCSSCPLQMFCVAYIKYDPEDFPKKEMKKINSFEDIGIGIVFNQDGELLIAKRLENSNMGGMWEFPGGKKKFDENITKTIEREINEEIGIEVNIGEKLVSFDHSYTHKRLSFTVHICEWRSGEPKALASQKILWVAPERLFEFPFPAANAKIISELQKYLDISN